MEPTDGEKKAAVAAGDAPPGDAPPPAAAASDAETRNDGRGRLAAEQIKIAKAKSELRQREQAMKHREADADLAQRIRQATAAGNHAEAMRLAGIDLNAAAAAYQPLDEAADLKRKVESLEAETKAARDAREESARVAAVERGRGIIAANVEKAADKFPLTHELGRSGEVFDLMAVMLQEHETELSFEEAAAEVERHLEQEEQAVQRAQQRRAAVAKGKGGAPAAAQSSSEQERAQQNAQSPTISSKLNGEAATAPPKPWNAEDYIRSVRAEFAGS